MYFETSRFQQIQHLCKYVVMDSIQLHCMGTNKCHFQSLLAGDLSTILLRSRCPSLHPPALITTNLQISQNFGQWAIMISLVYCSRLQITNSLISIPKLLQHILMMEQRSVRRIVFRLLDILLTLEKAIKQKSHLSTHGEETDRNIYILERQNEALIRLMNGVD